MLDFPVLLLSTIEILPLHHILYHQLSPEKSQQQKYSIVYKAKTVILFLL